MSADHPAGIPRGPASYPAAGPVGGTSDYPPSWKIAAVLLTIFIPIIALIAALVLLGPETSQARRAALRAWAIASGAWLATGLLIAVIAFASIASSMPRVSHSGPCVGGPAQGAAGVPIGHGNYRFNCVGGGSTVVHLGN
jgi:hypothetical protein